MFCRDWKICPLNTDVRLAQSPLKTESTVFGLALSRKFRGSDSSAVLRRKGLFEHSRWAHNVRWPFDYSPMFESWLPSENSRGTPRHNEMPRKSTPVRLVAEKRWRDCSNSPAVCSLPEVQTDNSERAYGSNCPTGQAMADVGCGSAWF